MEGEPFTDGFACSGRHTSNNTWNKLLLGPDSDSRRFRIMPQLFSAEEMSLSFDEQLFRGSEQGVSLDSTVLSLCRLPVILGSSHCPVLITLLGFRDLHPLPPPPLGSKSIPLWRSLSTPMTDSSSSTVSLTSLNKS